MEPDEREDLDEQTFCDVEESSSGPPCRKGHCEADPNWHAAPASAQGTGERVAKESCALCIGPGELCDQHEFEADVEERLAALVKRVDALEAARDEQANTCSQNAMALAQRLERLEPTKLQPRPQAAAPPQPAPVERTCEFCGCRTNAKLRACCSHGRRTDEKPAPVERHGFVPTYWESPADKADRDSEPCGMPDCGGQPRSAAVHRDEGDRK